MPQQEFIPTEYELSSDVSGSADHTIHLETPQNQSPATFTFEAVRPGVFKTTFWSESHPLPPFPSVLKPSTETTSFTGEQTGTRTKQIRSKDVEATIRWQGPPIVTIGFRGEAPLYEDLPFRSYAFDGTGVAHYTCYHRGSLHVGLGEKASPMDLSARHFTLSATDCFGYDVMRTDPMYKHIPLLFRVTPRGVVATFSTSHARGYYSVGSEMDGMWGLYKVYRQDFGGLEQYTLIGRTLEEVVRIYADLAGYPLLVPRWAFGYIAGGMKYSMLDEPRASDALMEFTEKLEKHGIPCSGFQMSSGYTVAEVEPKTRNVFTWNRHRFPDPKGFCDAFHAKGIRIIANIKPYVLASHPRYQSLKDAGALFVDPATGESGIARLWSAGGGESDEGGHIDFSSKAGYDFWYNGVKELRQIGMDCMWNDNNEYSIPSDNWQLALNHESLKPSPVKGQIGLWGRAMHCELMGKASHDALLEVMPHERPFVLTRSATAGTMRYACSSWSGDNVTSWDGMRGANALSLTAGLCLLQCYGHDIGGFEGPQPSPELLLRWIQLGCHSPRFAINCYKTGDDNLVGDVIEPWMYPAIVPQIRQAILRRYEMIPYLYSLMLTSHLTAVPPQRWIGWGYETDANIWTSRVLQDGEQQYWLGDTLIIGGVYQPDVNEARIYLPKRTPSDPGFLNTSPPFQHLSAGQWHTISAPWKANIPVIARIGGIIPVGKNRQVVAPGDKANEAHLGADDWRGVEIFPSPEELSDGTPYTSTWLEDDGFSPAPAPMAKFTVVYSATKTEVRVDVAKKTDAFVPPWVEFGLTVILPHGDSRDVFLMDGTPLETRRQDATGRRRFHLPDWKAKV